MSTQRAMRVTITDARAVCEATGARQVVVIAFDGAGRFAVTSYGTTKAECSAVKPLCDAVASHLAAGTLPAPEGR